MTRVAFAVATALAAALSASTAAAGAADAATRRELAELKALCDAALVAPAVCVEKQRAILGLPPRAEGAIDSAVPEETAPATGTVHATALGVRLTLPDGWTPLAPEQVAAGFEALRGGADGNPAAARLVDRLRAETAHRGATVFAKGRDTLEVARASAPPPADAADRATLCERLDAVTSEAAGRPLRTYACGTRLVSGLPAFHVERDGLLPATRTIQYWVPAREGSGVRIVMTCRAADADARRHEMEAIVGSVRWE